VKNSTVALMFWVRPHSRKNPSHHALLTHISVRLGHGERRFRNAPSCSQFCNLFIAQALHSRSFHSGSGHHSVVTKGRRRVTFGACTLAPDLVRLSLEFKFSIDGVSAIPSAPSCAVFGIEGIMRIAIWQSSSARAATRQDILVATNAQPAAAKATPAAIRSLGRGTSANPECN